LTTCQKGWEQAVRTHPVDKLLEQHCYKSAAGLLQLVRFTCDQTGEEKILYLMTIQSAYFFTEHGF
jgi:hypothetical protein